LALCFDLLCKAKVTLYVALAEGYFRLNRYKEALSYAQTATQVSPESQAGYASMAFIYFEMIKLKDAKRLFEKALTIDPASAPARYNLAMTCLAMKQKTVRASSMQFSRLRNLCYQLSCSIQSTAAR
jgi:tetratricopeptide (TPR) repeat protein